SDRYVRQPDRWLRNLHHRRDVRVRHHGRRYRLPAHVGHEQHVHAVMGAAVIRRSGEHGTTLVEVLIATGLLVTLMAGLMAMSGIAISTTENQGHLAARSTEYAMDKLEQLLALQYGDSTSDTRVFPASTSGGSGLAPGGSANVDSPVAL